MNRTRLVLTAFLVVLLPASAFGQSDWLLFRGQEPRFRLLYPPGWTLGTPRGPNVRATIFPPKGKPSANCNIGVRRDAKIEGVPQAELNRMINSEPWRRDDWVQMLEGRWPDLAVVSSRHTKVHNQPAYLGLLEFSSETVDRKTSIRALQLMTFTPGFVWSFGCAARGATLDEARRSYDHWERIFRRILGSLVFED